MTGTLSQTALGTFPIFQFLDVLLKTCSLFYWLYPFILFLITIFIFSVILTLDLCRASLKTTLCDVDSLSKDLIYYYYYIHNLSGSHHQSPLFLRLPLWLSKRSIDSGPFPGLDYCVTSAIEISTVGNAAYCPVALLKDIVFGLFLHWSSFFSLFRFYFYF